MTGIERLRALAYKKNFLEPAEARELDAIADQIERERVSRMRVLSVVTEMEHHILGHEGMEDSPIARWSRELWEALGGEEHDSADDVSVSAYDLLPQEDRDASAWVREHGGLDAVRRRWECLSYYADPVPRSCMEKRLARLQRQIDESHAALRRRREIISELNHRVCDLTRENAELRKRAMPEGYEWPRYESGEPLRYEDRYVYDGREREVWHVDFDSYGEPTILNKDGTRSHPDKGERFERPAPKVLDADGVEIRVGDEVWHVRGEFGPRFVSKFETHDGRPVAVFEPNGTDLRGCECDQLTHRAPVLASDGRPLREGETVWDTNGDELVIGALEDGGQTVTCRYVDVGDAIPVHGMWSPSDLTHTKPEPPDTWERIEEDADALVDAEINGEGSCNAANSYCNRRGLGEGTSFVLMARDLVRRARALAERERGE